MSPIEDAYKLDEMLFTQSMSPITIYRTSNENLNKLFSNFDVKDRDVLTVLGSGDQAIMSYLLGAKKVEIFDNEIYSYYFFCLRIWFMRYLKIYFIPHEFDYNSLLDKVIPNNSDEADALLFWKTYFNITKNKLDTSVFAISEEYDYISQFGYDEIKKICDMNYEFHHVNICKELVLEREHDVIIMSNILEWHQNRNYSLVRENFIKLLKNDGIVVCSNLMVTDRFNQNHRQEIKTIRKGKIFRLKEYKDKSGYQYKKMK